MKLPKEYKNKSVVVMDGPFMCLDPYKDGYHVLGHVEHAIHSTNVGDYPMVLNKDIVGYLNNGVIPNPKFTKIQKFISHQEYKERRFYDIRSCLYMCVPSICYNY